MCDFENFEILVSFAYQHYMNYINIHKGMFMLA